MHAVGSCCTAAPLLQPRTIIRPAARVAAGQAEAAPHLSGPWALLYSSVDVFPPGGGDGTHLNTPGISSCATSRATASAAGPGPAVPQRQPTFPCSTHRRGHAGKQMRLMYESAGVPRPICSGTGIEAPLTVSFPGWGLQRVPGASGDGP